MKDKIYIVNEYVHSSQNSTGYFWERVINKLIDDGYNVEVFSYTKHGVYRRRRSKILRAIEKVIGALRLFFKTITNVKKNAVLISGTNPEFLVIMLAIIKPLIRFKWYVFVSDVFPDNLIPANIIRKEALIYRLLLDLQRRAFKTSDVLLTAGRDMQALLTEKTGDPEKVKHLPHWVNSGEISVLEKSQSRILCDLGWTDKIVFQFFGNIGALQDIDNLLLAIDLVEAKNAAFIFIGQGTESKKIIEYIRNHPEKTIHYYGELSQSQKKLGLVACDVAIVSLVPGMKGLAVPSKAYFSLAADKPILAVLDEGSEISLMVEEEEIGWICPAGDPRSLAKTIESICDEDLVRYSGKLQRLAETKYSEETILHRLTEVLSS